MALSLEERKTAEMLKKSGKTTSEILRIIANQRAGILTPKEETDEPSSGFLAAVKDIPSDIGETVTNVASTLKTGLVDKPLETARNPEISTGAGLFRSIASGAASAGRAVGETLMGAGKLFTSPETEKAISETISSGAQSVLESPIAEKIKTQFDSLTPEQQAVLSGTGDIVEAGLGVVGFGPVLSKFKTVLNKTAQTSLQASDDILRKSKQSISTPIKTTIPKIDSSIVKDIRFALSDVDPQVETILQRSNFDEVNRYFQQAKNAKANPAKDTPLALAGEKAESAFDIIDNARKAAIKGKKSILEDVATQRVSGNTLNEVMSTSIQRINKRFGVNLDAKGNITQAKGRTSQFDTSDTKLVGDYFKRLNALGVSPTIQQVDDFIDWAQSQLYKQEKTLSKFEVASDPVIRELQSITGDLNGRLKTAVGNGYGEVNARISRLIELQDEVNRALGADARKGAGLMKSLFGPAGDNTRRIFEEIKQETGVDLIKEATLAKFAMEGVGDVRQRSLLQSLGAIEEALSVDLTKPGTWLKTIREKGDLDGQELANEIIRRSNASNP